MTNLTTHVEIRLHAYNLTAATHAHYEDLLEPFVRLPSLEKNIQGDRIGYNVHVYGPCDLTDMLLDAVFDMVDGLPEVCVELTRGTHTQETAVAVCRHGEAKAYRPLLNQSLNRPSYRVVLEGRSYNGGRADDAPPLRRAG